MQNLITNEQVISLAFGDGEYISPSVVLASDISAAEYRYIIPIVGEQLYEELLKGSHATLLNDYVAPALAMAVRTMIQPSLNVRTGQAGLHIPSSARADTSTKGVTNALHKSLRLRRQTLLKRLSSYLMANGYRFPSYDVREDIMQKWRIDGGYVQSV